MTVDRGFEFWAPERLWPGETCFLLGGGPSLDQETVDRLLGLPRCRVMAINSSCMLAPWADALFFTDNSWFEGTAGDGRPRRDIVAGWPGLVFTLHRKSKEAMPDKIKRLDIAPWALDFPRRGSMQIRQGRSSGHTAVSLALALGASLIVLLGYDMREIDGRSHHHDEYRNTEAGLYENDFVRAFAGWNEAALACGVRVLNATPGSALQEFPFVVLDDLLHMLMARSA